jgi:hypothetical protein
LIRELSRIQVVHEYTRQARKMAAICGIIELALTAPLAAAYGTALLLCAGLVIAVGLAASILAESRRNPTWMAIRATYHGRSVTIFSSTNRRVFESVRMAVVRAVEGSRDPRF